MIAMGVLALGALGVVGWYATHAGLEDTDDAQLDADVVSVPARIGGLVEKVLFVENQRVKAGDVLVELDHGAARRRGSRKRKPSSRPTRRRLTRRTTTSRSSRRPRPAKKGSRRPTLRGSVPSAATATGDQNAQADAQVKQATVARAIRRRRISIA